MLSAVEIFTTIKSRSGMDWTLCRHKAKRNDMRSPLSHVQYRTVDEGMRGYVIPCLQSARYFSTTASRIVQRFAKKRVYGGTGGGKILSALIVEAIGFAPRPHKSLQAAWNFLGNGFLDAIVAGLPSPNTASAS